MLKKPDFTFAINPHTTRETRDCVESIQRYTDYNECYFFVNHDEEPDIAPAFIDWLEEKGTLLNGENPIPGYGIGNKIQALNRAMQHAAGWNILLDNDTLVLDDVTRILEKNAGNDVLLREARDPTQYFSTPQSRDDWKTFYDEFGIPGTLPRRGWMPYYNAGVVMTRRPAFAREWLATAIQVYGELPASHPWKQGVTLDRFTDQVSLTLTALQSRYAIGCLPPTYNYTEYRTRCFLPSDVTILHYVDRRALLLGLLQERLGCGPNRLTRLGPEQVVDGWWDLLKFLRHPTWTRLRYWYKRKRVDAG